MPRFLIPIFVLALVSLTGFGFVFLRLSPEQTSAVILFVTTFFFSVAFTLSLIFFLVHKKFFFRPQAFTAFGPLITDDELRSLYRTSLYGAFVLALLVTVFLILRRFL